MPLPPNLTEKHVERAVQYIEREACDLIDLYFEQKNVFSAVIGILGIRALDAVSL